MEFVTVAGMKVLEAQNDACGLSYNTMMENAGKAAAALIGERLSLGGKTVLALCGQGNNGGDGFVSARELAGRVTAVTVALPLGGPKTQAAAEAFQTLAPAGVPVITDFQGCLKAVSKADIILDCLFGTGFRGSLTEPVRLLVEAVNQSGAAVVSYDIPSGVEADTGRYEYTVQSDLTIAFEAPKPAHLVHWRGAFLKELAIVSIGILPEVDAAFGGRIPAIDKEYFLKYYPWRSAVGHKGSNGRLVVVAGSRSYRGAAVLACRGALRSGAGLAHLLSTEEVCRAVVPGSPEAICTPCPQTPLGMLSGESLPLILQALESADALVLGCGLGRSPETARLAEEVLKAAKVPVVLDGDGLSVFAGRPGFFEDCGAPLILTPHPGEFSRLFGVHIDEAVNNSIHCAQTVSVQYGVTTVLKGPFTAVGDPEGGPMVSFLGNSGLARGGSGDLLAGIIGAMAARGLSTKAAAGCGLYLHGRGADLAAEMFTREAMLPGDVAELLPRVVLELEDAEGHRDER